MPVDLVFLGIFAFEFGLKAHARGFLFGSSMVYLRDSGNVMGFVVLGTGGREMLGMRSGSMKVPGRLEPSARKTSSRSCARLWARSWT